MNSNIRILVTGCNGQLGRELKIHFSEALPNLNVIYTDVDTLDITDRDAIERVVLDNDITHIINCAAYTNVDLAEEEKALSSAVNSIAVSNIALAASSNDAKILHISTDYVFDGTAHLPYNEADKVNPKNQYGVTKRLGETMLIGHSPDCIIIRTSWLYSPFGKNFVKTMLRLAATKPEVNVVSDQIGTPTYAADLAVVIAKFITARQWASGIYHFSNEGVCSWYDFAKAIYRIAGIHTKVNPIPTRDYPTASARPAYSVLDKSKIKATLGITIPHWEESLADCIDRLNQMS